MKYIDNCAYYEASDFHAVKTVYWARRILRKSTRIFTLSLIQGALLFIGFWGALKIIQFIYFK